MELACCMVCLSVTKESSYALTSFSEALQTFVREALNLNGGIWSSPDIALRSYSDTKSIALSGKLAKELEENLNFIASVSQDLARKSCLLLMQQTIIPFKMTKRCPLRPLKSDINSDRRRRKYTGIQLLWKA